jgi:hypothetical protein
MTICILLSAIYPSDLCGVAVFAVIKPGLLTGRAVALLVFGKVAAAIGTQEGYYRLSEQPLTLAGLKVWLALIRRAAPDDLPAFGYIPIGQDAGQLLYPIVLP